MGVNPPVNASVNAGIFDRNRRLARSAIAAGSSRPSISACSIARPDTPMMSVATVESLMPGVFEDLLDALHLSGTVAGQRGAGTDQITQTPDRFRGYQRSAQ